MAQPRTQFARVGDVNVGFQVFGEGPIDLVWIWGLASNIETIWEEPSYAAFLRRLGEFARVIVFDRRGSGVSDREGTASTPTLEERVEDVLTVLDAAGSTRAAAFGISEGGALAAVLAATHPERVERIVIYGTMARFLRDADHPWGWMDGAHLATFLEETRATWGTTEGGRDAVRRWAPSMVDDEQFTDWVSRQRRQSVSRGAIGPLLWGSVTAYDLVDVFPAVHVPTLVLHRTGDALIPIAQARWIAEQIPGARFVELPGNDHYPFVGDADGVLAEIEMFVGGGRDPRPRDRRLLTIAVTEVMSSACNLEHLRDDSWRELLAAHDRMTRTHLARFGGEELKRTGEGFVATFDGPARAIRCVLGVLDAAERLGLALRVGVHTGECDLVDREVTGLALHVATRIAELAEPGTILTSSTVRDLVAGAGIRFGESHEVDLAGMAGPRSVFEVLRRGIAPDTVRRYAIDHANVLRLDGEYWTVVHDGHIVTLRDSKGLRDIARLVAEPHREHHVLDLASPADREGRTVLAARGTEPIIDDTARARYKRRIDELQADIDDAGSRGDGETESRLREELEALVDELSSAYGLGGHVRRAPDNVERARKAVTRRVRDAVLRVERAHPTLGRHLRASVRTGVFCSYAPEHELTWLVEPTPDG